jgi:hypothetical protein
MAVARALGRAVDRSSRHDSTRPRHQDPHVRRRVAIGLIAVVNAADAILAVPARARGVERAIANGRALNDLARERTDLRTVLLGARPPRAGQPGQTRRPAHARRPAGLSCSHRWTAVGRTTPDDWMPEFLDYVALAVATATAFSAGDTVPISACEGADERTGSDLVGHDRPDLGRSRHPELTNQPASDFLARQPDSRVSSRHRRHSLCRDSAAPPC